jgi:hypothetical protein
MAITKAIIPKNKLNLAVLDLCLLITLPQLLFDNAK